MSEVEQRIAAMNRERAGHLWSAAVRLQREVLELRGEMEGVREVNAELLMVLEDCAKHSIVSDERLEKICELIAKAERLK
jgi:hypothetical protein